MPFYLTSPNGIHSFIHSNCVGIEGVSEISYPSNWYQSWIKQWYRSHGIPYSKRHCCICKYKSLAIIKFNKPLTSVTLLYIVYFTALHTLGSWLAVNVICYYWVDFYEWICAVRDASSASQETHSSKVYRKRIII